MSAGPESVSPVTQADGHGLASAVVAVDGVYEQFQEILELAATLREHKK